MSGTRPDEIAAVVKVMKHWKVPEEIWKALESKHPVGPGRYGSPRHATHDEPSFVKLNGIQ
jgi:hypothetical protein